MGDSDMKKKIDRQPFIIEGNWKGVYKPRDISKKITKEELSVVHKETVEPGSSYIIPYDYIESSIIKKGLSDE